MRPPGLQFREPILIFLLTALISAAAALAIGANLGAFLAGMIVCLLLLPFALSPQHRLAQSLLSAACVTDSIALIWLVMALAPSPVSLWMWLQAYLLLLSIALFQLGLIAALRLLRISVLSAGGLSILLLMLWMAAPVWLLHHLQTPSLLPLMQRLIDLHPIFAMNAAVPLGIWTESPLAYRILNLNQDVYYTMPPGPWLAILAHAAIGAMLTWIKVRISGRLYK